MDAGARDLHVCSDRQAAGETETIRHFLLGQMLLLCFCQWRKSAIVYAHQCLLNTECWDLQAGRIPEEEWQEFRRALADRYGWKGVSLQLNR